MFTWAQEARARSPALAAQAVSDPAGRDQHDDPHGQPGQAGPGPSGHPSQLARVEQVTADGQTPVEDVAQHLLAGQDPGQRHRGPGDDAEAALGGVGRRRIGVDGRHLEGELDAAHAGQVDGQAEQVGSVGQRWEGPGERQGEVELVGRVLVLGQSEDGVLEREQRAGVDLEGQVQVERAATAVLGMELHLPDLTERVGLDEVALVVHVEPMVDRMVLEVGHVSGHIDDCHRQLSLPGGRPPVTADSGNVAAWTTPRCSRCCTPPPPP